MTKKDLVNKIVEETGKQYSEVLPIVESLLNSVKTALEDGLHIEIRGFGTFQNIKRAEKIARHIKNNEPIIIPAHLEPVFHFSQDVKDRIKVVKL